jgi:hypothetical protein
MSEFRQRMKLLRRKKKKKSIPPTFRFCITCGKETKFVLKKSIGHSRCTECGGWVTPSNVIKELKSKESNKNEDVKKNTISNFDKKMV